MRKELFVGKRDAMLVATDQKSVFEIVIAYGYNEENKTWIEGHYFSAFGNITVQDKMEVFKKAFDYWATHDYE